MDKNKKIIIGCVIGVIVVLIAIFLCLNSCSNAKTYTVTFIDSIDNKEISSVSVKENEKVEKPAEPKKVGYTFDNWYLNDEIYDFDTKVTKDMTIEARFISSSEDKIELKETTLGLIVDEDKQIEIASFPEGVSRSQLIWISSDEEIVAVDENGNLKAIREGSCTITIKTKDGKYSSTLNVTVTKNKVSVESVSITGSREVMVGKTIKLTANVKPDDATDKEVTWKSSNTSIATVDRYGNVKGIKAGTVTITVTTTDGGKTATYNVTVKASSNTGGNTQGSTGESKPKPEEPKVVPVTGVTITGKVTDIKVGESHKLSAQVSPGDATNKKVKWSSSNPSVATVAQSGNLVGVDDGDTVITVTTEDGSKTDSYTVHVSSVYEIHLKKIQLVEGSEAQYSKTVYKNNKIFTGYQYFSMGNKRVSPSENVMASFTQNETITETTIRIDSKSYPAKIVYE